MFKNLFKKSAQGVSDTPIYLGNGCYYMQASSSRNPHDLIAQNKGFVFACNQKINQYLASVPIHLYAYSDEDMLTPNKTITKSLKLDIKRNLSKKALEAVEITEHPLLDFLDEPQLGCSWNDFISKISSYLNLMGNCLLEDVDDKLEVLKWEYVQPYINPTTGKIDYYDYHPNYGMSRRLYPNKVVHIKLDNLASVIGMGKLEGCVEAATLYSWFDAYQINLARNYGMPGVSINVKNKIGSKEEAQKIAEEFKAKFGGTNAGKPLVSFGDVDVQTISTTVKEQEYSEGRKYAIKMIAACFGVPEDLISTEDSNRASSATAIKQFYSITIFPFLTKILESINSQYIAPKYDKNLWLYFDKNEVITEDPKAQADVFNSYIQSGVLTKNEVRNALGYEELEEEEPKIEDTISQLQLEEPKELEESEVINEE